MRLFCLATVPDKRQKANLVQCIQILGGNPQTITDAEVSLHFEGSSYQCQRFIELFDQYPEHGIWTQESTT